VFHNITKYFLNFSILARITPDFRYFTTYFEFCVKIVTEKVQQNTPNYRLERENFWIEKLATKTPLGLNKNY
jgi:hypothetical protein